MGYPAEYTVGDALQINTFLVLNEENAGDSATEPVHWNRRGIKVNFVKIMVVLTNREESLGEAVGEKVMGIEPISPFASSL